MEYEVVDIPKTIRPKINWVRCLQAALDNPGKAIRVDGDPPNLRNNFVSAASRHFRAGIFRMNAGDGCLYITKKEKPQ